MTKANADNVDTIRAFLEAWSRLDPEELAGYFLEDGTYHNMPAGPVTGRDNVKEFIAGFTATWTATEWELVNIVGAGDVVIAERVDRTQTSAGDVDLPCVGVFEMSEGRIREWRDYFDLDTYMRAMKS